MYLVDTNVISEARKKSNANPGVDEFFKDAVAAGEPVYLSAVTVGELRRGVELIRHRGDDSQAEVHQSLAPQRGASWHLYERRECRGKSSCGGSRAGFT